MSTYGASPITRRTRRSKLEIAELKKRIRGVLAEDNPMTVRQLFYRLVGLGAIAKTEQEYKSTVCRLLVQMRSEGQLPYAWIADNTRWMRKPTTYGSYAEALAETARSYRRALWDDQNAYVEIWLEKDALAGVLYAVTGAYDVPLMVTRGYPSLTFLYEAAQTIRETGLPTHLYYLGDYDPSGLDIPRNVEERLREFAPGYPFTFERIAVTAEHIVRWNLPTRPTKRSDSRSAGFAGESVEVDAIPSADLRTLVEDHIVRHLDPAALKRTRRIEAEERRSLLTIAREVA